MAYFTGECNFYSYLVKDMKDDEIKKEYVSEDIFDKTCKNILNSKSQ